MRKSATDPRGYDLVEITNAGAWRAVNADGTFTFDPDVFWFDVTKAKVVYEGGQYYVWASAGGVRSASNCPCYEARSTGWSDRFKYRQVTPSTSATAGAQSVQDVWSNIRCMPGAYDESRLFPMPIAGNGLLYSATNEGTPGVSCPVDDPTVGPYTGARIIVTSIP